MNSTEKFSLVVDYAKDLNAAIVDSRYRDNNNLGSLFKYNYKPELLKEKLEITVKLFPGHYNGNVDTNHIIINMDKEGFRPATLIELLALAEEHPELVRCIMTPGAVVDLNSGRCLTGPNGKHMAGLNSERSPYNYFSGSGGELKRYLFLTEFHQLHASDSLFLGVEKSN